MSVKSLSSHISKHMKKNKRVVRKTVTPQHTITKANQVFNNAGGAVFKVTPLAQLERFLILGSEGGTYYSSERKLTQDNAKNALRAIKDYGQAAVDLIVDVSRSRRAPKNDPALLALALAATYGEPDTRRYAMQSLPDVARIGTHMFHFAEFVNSIRGWGRLLKEGIQDWYQNKDIEQLALQVVKYQQRDGWSHRDLIRLSHPKADSVVRNNIYKYVTKGPESIEAGAKMPGIIVGFEKAKTANEAETIKLIKQYDLTREMVMTEHLNSCNVWDALLEKMPMTAMIRNLGKMTSIGLLKPSSHNTAEIVNRLTDKTLLEKAKIHPYTILLALSTYAKGAGIKGNLTWAPSEQIKAALDEAFYLAFGYIKPTGKRMMQGLDVSGSMASAYIANSALTAREAAGAMALVTARVEKDCYTMGFGSDMIELKRFKPSLNLTQVMGAISGYPLHRTDCSLPMTWATKIKAPVDVFTIYTDNETWCGPIHPFQALKTYRQKMGIDAKLVVVGMTSTQFTIADPSDWGMLDVVGFDTAAPNLISEFSTGRF